MGKTRPFKWSHIDYLLLYCAETIVLVVLNFPAPRESNLCLENICFQCLKRLN